MPRTICRIRKVSCPTNFHGCGVHLLIFDLVGLLCLLLFCIIELAQQAFITITIKPSAFLLCNGRETMARPVSFPIPLCMSDFLPTFAPLLYVGGRTQAPIHTIHHKTNLFYHLQAG
jgi:hypothetical protein